MKLWEDLSEVNKANKGHLLAFKLEQIIQAFSSSNLPRMGRGPSVPKEKIFGHFNLSKVRRGFRHGYERE
uniref:Uncharacterized protein n=1 Tax=Lepeophtheirus salmonis TaxID=72036 RepID=A0A0K2UX23_LEPSM